MSDALALLSSQRCFAGELRRYRHAASTVNCDMVFSIFLPQQALMGARVPVLYWLSGLTCTDENFMQKAGAQRVAAELGIVLVSPDTSPRGEGVPGDPDGAWDFGLGAGFYVNATQQPWAQHYQMHDYVVHELPDLIEQQFPVTQQRGIAGHSMGGHGALVCALRHPGRYQSVSAFAPIVNPMRCPWGQKAFSRYLGEDQATWREWDATELLTETGLHLPILIDQGTEDNFLATQLMPENMQIVAQRRDYPLTLRMHTGYDHSYYFIATFIEDHVRHHARAMLEGAQE